MFDKKAYQRQYMRNKRAGRPTRQGRKPRPQSSEWQPTSHTISEIKDIIRRPPRSGRWRDAKLAIVEGLKLALPKEPDDLPPAPWELAVTNPVEKQRAREVWVQAMEAQSKAEMDHALSDPAWQAAFCRYRDFKAKKQTAGPRVRRCLFCHCAETPDNPTVRVDIPGSNWRICQDCIRQRIELLQPHVAICLPDRSQ